MSLNIKNEETCALVHELADITGESMTGAIDTAVRERLDRTKKVNDLNLADRLLAIGKDCSKRLSKRYRTVEHGEMLYGKDGLPK